jgi:beta-phosphoglucomutase
MDTKLTACIFDLDGVLVDTAKYHFLAWQRMAKDFHYDLTEEVNELLKGVSRMDSLDIILAKAGVSLTQEEKNRYADQKNIWFNQYLDQMEPSEIFPGAKSLLQHLRARHYKVALASSSKNAAKVLRLLQIEHLFDAVVDGTMIKASKPDPEVFLMAASKIGAPPATCVVFEDAEAGVEAAHRAGMKCVGVGTSDQLIKADLRVRSISEFNESLLYELV